MIDFLKQWCEGIIVAVIISIIIESILPEGNNKKYVKVVIGIYIIFTILNPLVGNITTEIELNNPVNLAKSETVAVDSASIQEVYATGLEETLKTAVKDEFGYEVQEIEIIFDANYETIQQMNLKIAQAGIQTVNQVEIGEQKEEKTENDYQDVKKYLCENYEISKNNINIY